MKSVSQTGKVVEWNDARGFGFIESPGTTGRIFFHIKDVAGSLRPAVGDDVAYAPIAGRDGRPAAGGVRIAGSPSRADDDIERHDAPMRVTVRLVGALVLATAIVCCVVAGRAPLWLALVYVVAGVVSFAAYWHDKRAAVRGAWRTMEGSLHFYDLAFGIAGGLMAQGLLRHKSSKREFGRVSATIFTLHMIALGLLLAGYDPASWVAWLTA